MEFIFSINLFFILTTMSSAVFTLVCRAVEKPILKVSNDGATEWYQWSVAVNRKNKAEPEKPLVTFYRVKVFNTKMFDYVKSIDKGYNLLLSGTPQANAYIAEKDTTSHKKGQIVKSIDVNAYNVSIVGYPRKAEAVDETVE